MVIENVPTESQTVTQKPALVSCLNRGDLLCIEISRSTRHEGLAKRGELRYETCMSFDVIGWPVGDGAGNAERMVLRRLVEQRKARAVGRVDLRMEVPPSARHHSQSLCHTPFVLQIQPEPILFGKLIKDIRKGGIMAIVEAVSQPV